MPNETSQAIEWALTQEYTDLTGVIHVVTKIDTDALVSCVRTYFNTHSISYATFSFTDLQPYL